MARALTADSNRSLSTGEPSRHRFPQAPDRSQGVDTQDKSQFSLMRPLLSQSFNPPCSARVDEIGGPLGGAAPTWPDHSAECGGRGSSAR